MKITNRGSFIVGMFVALIMVIISNEAGATGNNHNDDVTQEQRQGQDQHQGQGQAQGQVATGGNATADGGSATASNDGVDASDNSVSNVENNSSQVVLVPNNNTESCVRVWGLAFGKDGASGALGIPWRSAACDFEQAADDAFAAGERELGWFWKCKNKNLYKGFRMDGMSKDEAMHQCHLKSVGYVTAMKTIDDLRSQLEFVNNERKIESQKCKESTDRISKAWQESCASK